ncbi:MAG: BamA/TamA family outer membrane protein [Kofleriaceae bacterium]
MGAGILALAACGARPAAPRRASGGAQVGEVRLEGVSHVDRGELLSGLALVRARDLSQEFAGYLVTLDRERIRGLYYRRGFFSAAVQDRVAHRRDHIDVTFAVIEGPRARLVRVDVTGVPPSAPVTAAQLRAEVPLRDGAPFDYDAYDEARPALVTALQELGYASAQVTSLVLADRARAEAVIRLSVELGVRSTFGPISLDGIDGALAASVRARLRFAEGELFSPRKVEDTRADLYEMGRFSLVRIELTPSDTSPAVPVRLTLGESPPNDLRLGGGVGVTPVAYELRGQAVYGRAGWPTTLTNTRAELRPALVIQREDRRVQPRLDAIAGLDRLDLWLPRVRGTAEAAFTYLALEAYTDYGPRLRLGLRAPLVRRTIQANVGWQLQLLRFRDLDAAIDDATAARLGLDRVERLGFYEQSVTVELRDNPLDPRRGLYGELRLEEGTAAAGGAFAYVRVVPELRGYLSAGALTLALRGRVGATFGDLPVTQRFFAGGANSQRGFAERQLAPFASSTTTDGATRSVVYGGGASLELNAELRFPLFTVRELPIAGVAFADAADVTERHQDLELARPHLALGGGLRLGTPIGAVRFDLGVRVNRLGAEEPGAGRRYAYHLSIGEAF